MRIGRAHDVRDDGAHVLAGEVEPVRQAVHLERDAGLERDLDRPLEIEGVLRPVADQAAQRMAEAAHRRVAHRLRDARGQLCTWRTLAAVQRERVQVAADLARLDELSRLALELSVPTSGGGYGSPSRS